MGSVSVCDECHGAGAHGYERGPAVERCPRCLGAGLLFSSPATALGDLTAALTSARSAEFFALGEGGLVRAVAALASQLETRVSQLEHTIEERQ
jgi:hypothetical protein